MYKWRKENGNRLGIPWGILMDLLERWHWTGTLQQLKNVVIPNIPGKELSREKLDRMGKPGVKWRHLLEILPGGEISIWPYVPDGMTGTKSRSLGCTWYPLSYSYKLCTNGTKVFQINTKMEGGICWKEVTYPPEAEKFLPYPCTTTQLFFPLV